LLLTPQGPTKKEIKKSYIKSLRGSLDLAALRTLRKAGGSIERDIAVLVKTWSKK
jgi:hypothetical protein